MGSALDQAPVRSRTRRQRLSLVAGLVLVLGGLGLLGWVGWEMYGTTWVSERKHAEAIDALTLEWEQGQDLARVEAGTVSAVVRIPRFGDDYRIPLLEGTSDAALASGIGHFGGSSEPGALGNFALAGHRVTHGEPLRRMPELRPGDEIVVETRERIFTYVLDTGGDDLTVPFTDVWVLDRRPVNPDPDGVSPREDVGGRLITLTTCAELFHTDDRLVAFGHLVSATPR